MPLELFKSRLSQHSTPVGISLRLQGKLVFPVLSPVADFASEVERQTAATYFLVYAWRNY